MDGEIFFLDYGGCHAIASFGYALPTKIRRTFYKRLEQQLEYEKDAAEKAGKKARR